MPAGTLKNAAGTTALFTAGSDYTNALWNVYLLKDDKTRVEAAIGVSRCLQSEGEYDQALETVETALKDRTKEARLLARQAELLYLRGRWPAAEKAAEDALKVDKEILQGQYLILKTYCPEKLGKFATLFEGLDYANTVKE